MSAVIELKASLTNYLAEVQKEIVQVRDKLDDERVYEAPKPFTNMSKALHALDYSTLRNSGFYGESQHYTFWDLVRNIFRVDEIVMPRFESPYFGHMKGIVPKDIGSVIRFIEACSKKLPESGGEEVGALKGFINMLLNGDKNRRIPSLREAYSWQSKLDMIELGINAETAANHSAETTEEDLSTMLSCARKLSFLIAHHRHNLKDSTTLTDQVYSLDGLKVDLQDRLRGLRERAQPTPNAKPEAAAVTDEITRTAENKK